MQYRSFASSSVAFARRRLKFADSSSGLGADALSRITGNINLDGLHRYDLDFLETADWVKKLLLKMKTDLTPDVANTFSSETSYPLAFQSTQKFTYDFTVPNPTPIRTRLLARVDGLGLTTREQIHKLLVLAGDAYDPYQGVITLFLHENEIVAKNSGSEQNNSSSSSNRSKSVSGEEEIVPPQSVREKLILVERLERLVAEAKSGEDTMADIPVDLRHVAGSKKNGKLSKMKKRVNLSFPETWLASNEP